MAKAQTVTKSRGFYLGSEEEVDFREVDVRLKLDCRDERRKKQSE